MRNIIGEIGLEFRSDAAKVLSKVAVVFIRTAFGSIGFIKTVQITGAVEVFVRRVRTIRSSPLPQASEEKIVENRKKNLVTHYYYLLLCYRVKGKKPILVSRSIPQEVNL